MKHVLGIFLPFTFQKIISVDLFDGWISSETLPCPVLSTKPWDLFKAHCKNGPKLCPVLKMNLHISGLSVWKFTQALNKHPPNWSYLSTDAAIGYHISSSVFDLSRAPGNHSLSHSMILGINKCANSDLSRFVLVKSVLSCVFLLIAN